MDYDANAYRYAEAVRDYEQAKAVAEQARLTMNEMAYQVARLAAEGV